MRKRKLAILLCFMLFCSAGYTKTVGFACLYKADSPAGAHEFTAALETELFEFCFDHGIVATSIECQSGEIDSYEDNNALVKKFDASIDFLVVLYCEYKAGRQDTMNSQYAALDWRSLRWKIIDFSSRTTVFEKSCELKKMPETDPVLKMKKTGRVIGDSLLSTLETGRGH